MIAPESLVAVPSRERGMVEVQWVEDGKVLGHYGYKESVGFLERNRGLLGPPWVRWKSTHNAIKAHLLKLYDREMKR